MNQPDGTPGGRMEMGAGDVLTFVDTGNHLVRALDPDGTVRTVAGRAPAPYAPSDNGEGWPAGGYADGPALDALFSSPMDVALAPDGTIYVADNGNSCIRRIDPAGEVTTFAGVCGQRGRAGDGGPATDALLDRPYGVALDPAGNVYIADTHNQVIRVVYAEDAP
jgi:serine/threonine-protein kinase